MPLFTNARDHNLPLLTKAAQVHPGDLQEIARFVDMEQGGGGEFVVAPSRIAEYCPIPKTRFDDELRDRAIREAIEKAEDESYKLQSVCLSAHAIMETLAQDGTVRLRDLVPLQDPGIGRSYSIKPDSVPSEPFYEDRVNPRELVEHFEAGPAGILADRIRQELVDLVFRSRGSVITVAFCQECAQPHIVQRKAKFCSHRCSHRNAQRRRAAELRP